MKKIKCIIFDCDGVLVDSETISNQVLIEMLKPLGLEMTINDALRKFSGSSLKSCFLQIEHLIQKTLPADFENEYRKKTFAAFKSELKPIKGVSEFIQNLDIAYCVASSGPVEKIVLNLTTTGLIEKFEHKIFSSYQINSWKPEPDIFLFAAKEMGFSCDECIVIEDSKTGVMAGIKGGFTVYGLANTHTEKELHDGGAIVFHSFEALTDILYPKI
jgi:HAD superfamily hydrolase (TIGR01509 family)